MAENGDASRLGRVLYIIGILWVAMVFISGAIPAGGTPLGDILAFLRSSFFIGIALIFFGRTLTRRARRARGDDVFGTQPERPRRVERPAPRRPAPPPPSTTASRPTFQVEPLPEPGPVDTDRLAEVLGPGTDDEAGADEPADSAPPAEGEHHPKTSAEMIEEARRRLSND